MALLDVQNLAVRFDTNDGQVNAVDQISFHIDPGEWESLVGLIPNSIRRVQVIHVDGADALDRIAEYEPFVHAFLLDSGRPSADVPVLGGTGKTHDWSVSSQFVDRSTKPVSKFGHSQILMSMKKCYL